MIIRMLGPINIGLDIKQVYSYGVQSDNKFA